MSGVGSPPWSQASAPIWSLVSGYPSRLRAGKPLFFLQAFTDDSATDARDKRLFLAGYLHRADIWAEFSDVWDRALRAAPSIEYLKMVEANGLRGQFAGWSRIDRDKKLQLLALVIKSYDFLSFQTSISRSESDELLKPIVPRGLGSPHFTCNFAIVSSVARQAASLNEDLKIEFIFDEQSGVDADVAIFFDIMRHSLPEKARRIINGRPIFKDDKTFMPLQAADMLAWHIRKEYEIEKCLDDPLFMADLLIPSLVEGDSFGVAATGVA